MNLDELYSVHSKPKSKSNNLFKLYIIIAVISIISISYARYAVGGDVSVFVDIAKFNVSINNTPLSTEKNCLSNVINLVIDENGSEDGLVRCGQKGHFDIIIDPTNSETDLEYILQLNPESLPEGFIIDQYSLNDFSVRNYLNDSKTISGEITLNQKAKLDENDKKIYRFYFEWGGNHSVDISDYMVDVTALIKQKIV